jgi:para-nitrobenzyl esterase
MLTRFHIKHLIPILFFLLMIKTSAQTPHYPDVVKVDGGSISGLNNLADDIHFYKGIPFAAPPVGGLRWKAPQPVISWDGVKKCEIFSASPMQGKPVPFGVYTSEFLIPESPISEDCLYLNVWTGAKLPSEKRPVMVWIYGGGFASGGTGVPIYDGVAMAKKGVVFVSINYRVGIFGFFAHPDLTKESGNHASGNYGLMDQIAALKWVKKNIAAFGGNPDNITIAGQSAGSMSVNCLVASPLCRGLFQHAIAESGAMFLNGINRSNVTLAESEAAGEKIMGDLHVSSIEELRKIPSDELMKKGQGIRAVIIDGYVLPDLVSNIFSAGKQNDVDVITGWNGDDGFSPDKIKSAEEFKAAAQDKYGKDAGLFLKFYPSNTNEEAAISQLKISRDMIFGIQNYTWANMQVKTGKSKIYVYNFNRKVPATADFLKYGAFHTGEVAYAYDNLAFENRPWAQTDRDIATLMSSYWVNFARSGDPNGKGLPLWIAYDTKEKRIMAFDEQSSVQTLPTKDALDFLIGELK